MLKQSHLYSFQNVAYDSTTIVWTGIDALIKHNVSYKIYYVNTTLTELSGKAHHHLERDSCSFFSWKSKYLRHNETKKKGTFLYYNLTDLRPFTRYAYFIQTYDDEEDYYTDDTPYKENSTRTSTNADNSTHVKNSTKSDNTTTNKPSTTTTKPPTTVKKQTPKFIYGQSAVKFFKTKFFEPSRVVDVEASMKTHTSITLSWDVVGDEHLIITHFIIDVTDLPEDLERLDRRNYCDHPIVNFEAVQNDISDEEEQPMSLFECCKKCAAKSIKEVVPSYMESNKFDEDILKNRGKRDAYFMDFGRLIHQDIFENHPEKEVFRKEMREVDRTMPDSPNFIGRKIIEKELRSFTIEQLEPFHNYEFKIFTCAEDDDKNAVCSTYELYYNRTLRNPDYDKVQIEPEYSADYSSFKFTFMEPRKQNSAITSYNIQYSYFNGHESVLFERCLPRKQHEMNNFT